MRRNSVFAAVGPGDVLISTVGPFAKWGDAAVRAAIAASGAVYLDSTGEPVFIRRVFEELGGAGRARRGHADARDGLRLRARRPGGRAGAARGRAGRDARRRRLLLARDGRRRRQRGHARVARRRDAQRQPRLPRRGRADGPPGRARAHLRRQGQGAQRDLRRRRRALHAPARPPRACSRSTSTSAGSARWRSRCRRARWPGRSRSSCPGVRSVLQAAGERLVSLAGAPEAGHDAGHAVLDRRDRLRRRRRAARRGPRHRHRRLRLHGLLHGLGRPARRRAATGRTRSARSGRSRRSASTRSRRAVPRRACARSARTPQQRRQRAAAPRATDPGRAQLAVGG